MNIQRGFYAFSVFVALSGIMAVYFSSLAASGPAHDLETAIMGAESDEAIDIILTSGELDKRSPIILSRNCEWHLLSMKPPFSHNKLLLIGKVAACYGSETLLRFAVRTYGGEAEGEIKGMHIEAFLRNYPTYFLSLPDATDLWLTAGGAHDCCNDPEQTIAILQAHEGPDPQSSARRILDDIRNALDNPVFDKPWKDKVKQFLRD